LFPLLLIFKQPTNFKWPACTISIIFNEMIELILGPMFSGKSSELLRKVRRFEIAKKRCLVINYTHDNRYSSEEVMSTHDKY